MSPGVKTLMAFRISLKACSCEPLFASFPSGATYNVRAKTAWNSWRKTTTTMRDCSADLGRPNDRHVLRSVLIKRTVSPDKANSGEQEPKACQKVLYSTRCPVRTNCDLVCPSRKATRRQERVVVRQRRFKE